LATKLAGVAQLEPSKLFGDFHQGNATEVVEVPGVNHATILYSQDAARTIVSWLDSVFGTKRTGGIMLSDPRLSAVIVALILFIALLIPVGRLSGSMTRAWPQLGDAGGWTGLLILVGPFVAAMPLVSMVPPVAFVPLEIGQEQLSLFAVAGLIMIGFLAITGRLARVQI